MLRKRMDVARAAAKGPLILVVDDDASVREALVFALTIEGFTVEVCESGEALVARGDDPVPACLVLDQHLQGVSGIEALAALRARGVTWPTLVVTTHPKADLRAAAAELGARILEKPLLGGTLPAVLREILDL
jgi:two-component system response regulator FixJ